MADEFVWPIRVYHEDIDAGGVVFHANYLRYMERARTEWLRKWGFEHCRLVEECGIMFVVHTLSIKYHRPMKLDDLIEVRSRITGTGGASLYFEQTINKGDQSLICNADIRIACLNAGTFKPVSLPREILTEINNVI